MRTPAEIAALRAACESWVGTQFVPNSAVKGAGVCCHKFCGAAYVEAGWMSADLALPDGYPFGSEANTADPFQPWLDSSPHFAERKGEMQPGDLILSRPYRLPWHLAIYLGDRTFAHVDMRQGVQVTNMFPAGWLARVVRVYEPISQ